MSSVCCHTKQWYSPVSPWLIQEGPELQCMLLWLDLMQPPGVSVGLGQQWQLL